MADEVTFEKLGDALGFVNEKREALQQSAESFKKAFTELTGFAPQQQVTALDVVTICHRIYGEPKADD